MFDVEVDNLTKRFGDFCAVDGLSFDVEHGEVFGLLGPNGAGKSTLIRMLTTLVPPTSGTARINGFDVVRSANDVRQCIGVIPQAMTSDLDLSAEENMSIFAKLYGIPREKRRRIIAELLEAVDLSQWADKPVKMFSGGMRRRLEIARGLVHEPKIFFLDEPTTGLDPGLARRRVGDAVAPEARARPDHPGHHPLHGRGRQALRPHRHRRPRQAGGARLAAEAEGLDPRARTSSRSASPTCPPAGRRRCRRCPTSPRSGPTTTSSASRRTTARARRWS